MGEHHGHQLFLFGEVLVITFQIGNVLEEVGHDGAVHGSGVFGGIVGRHNEFKLIAQSGHIIFDGFQYFDVRIGGANNRNGFSGKGGRNADGKSEGKNQGDNLFHEGQSPFQS